MHDLCKSVQIINRALGHKQGTKIERVVLNRVCIFGIFCPKQGQGFKPYSGSPIPKYWSSNPLPSPPGLEYRYRIGVHIKPDSFRCSLRTVDAFSVVASLPPRRERSDDRKCVCSSQAIFGVDRPKKRSSIV